MLCTADSASVAYLLSRFVYVPCQVDPVISPLLHRVLKARPQNVASFVAQDLQQLALSAPPSEASKAS